MEPRGGCRVTGSNLGADECGCGHDRMLPVVLRLVLQETNAHTSLNAECFNSQGCTYDAVCVRCCMPSRDRMWAVRVYLNRLYGLHHPRGQPGLADLQTGQGRENTRTCACERPCRCLFQSNAIDLPAITRATATTNFSTSTSPTSFCDGHKIYDKPSWHAVSPRPTAPAVPCA